MSRAVGWSLTLAAGWACAEPSDAPPRAAAPERGSNSAVVAAVMEARADVAAAADELIRLREAVARERAPLAARMEAVQTDVRRLRTEAEQLRRRRETGRQDCQAAAARAESLEEQCRFIHTLLSEYRRSIETRAGPAESARMRAALSAADDVLADAAGLNGLPEATRRLLTLAAEWNREKLGGMGFDGEALDARGLATAGRFAVFGPLTYFSGARTNFAGMAVPRAGSGLPAVERDPGTVSRTDVATVAAGGEANVPIDVSGGAALRVAQSRDTPFEHIRKGGVVMAPLLAVGALALVLMVWKLFTFRRLAYRWGPEVEQVAEKARRGDDEGARALALRLGRPLSILLCDGLRHRAASREQMEEVLFEQIQTQLPSLERHLAALAVLGGVAPLLGLLGTVTGMIHTFRLVTIFGTGDARLLSGGISEALITTEFGLAIAIPVLLVHAYLVRRVRGVVAELEQTAATFIHALGAEGANRD